MKVLPVVIVCLAALAASMEGVRADDRTPEQIKAAKEFTVEGIGFSATPQTIRTKWPSAERVAKECDAKLGWETLRVGKTPNTDGIDFSFLDGKLVLMWVWYFPERTNQMGGWEVIPRRIVDKLGKAEAGSNEGKDEDEIFRADWVIPEANRFIRFIAEKKRSILIIVDREMQKQLEQKRQAAANTGF